MLTGILFAAITLGPLTMIHTQWLTGPLVNTMLLLTAALVGPLEAAILGFFPSPIALMSGLLPGAFAPMIPFIMTGNAIYILGFHFLRNRSAALGVILGSTLKFCFLILTARLIVAPFLPASPASTLSLMMGLPQLFTALIGGAIALPVISFLSARARSHR
jgi:hypothetical protein